MSIPLDTCPGDLAYLAAKGALSIPSPNLQNELLNSFTKYIYPQVPVIDMHNLREIIHYSDGDAGKINLLLFQAIMFAGIRYVDSSLLMSEGYSSRKAAEEAFYQKLRVRKRRTRSKQKLTLRKLLYDLDYENDRLTCIQAVLIMTSAAVSVDKTRDMWYWLGIVISHSYALRLNRMSTYQDLSATKQRLLRRIWWACVISDGILAVTEQRPLRIKAEDFDIPLICDDDFDLESASDASRPKKAHDARMFIQKAALCAYAKSASFEQYFVQDRLRNFNTPYSTEDSLNGEIQDQDNGDIFILSQQGVLSDESINMAATFISGGSGISEIESRIGSFSESDFGTPELGSLNIYGEISQDEWARNCYV
jgi:hypothetical protein